MANLLYYIEQFSTLTIANISGDKAPHKPILLLSVIDLIESNEISSCYIELTDGFIDAFKRNWNNYINENTRFKANIDKPFWHMNSESFWDLIAMNGNEKVTKANFTGTPYSINNLRKQIKYAKIDSDLFKLIQNDHSRNVLRDALINKHLIFSIMTDHKVDFSNFRPIIDSELRNYQQKNKEKVYDAWAKCRSVMLQMPTGTGKTRLFVSIVKDLHNWGRDNKQAVKILILAHRSELIDQISSNLGVKYGLAHGVIMASNMERRELPIQVGSVPTLNRRLQNWSNKEFDVIIVDEAHHIKADSYRKIIEEFPMAKVLGVTATPCRLNGAGFKDEFDDLILSDSVSKFIKNNYLSEYEYYSIKASSTTQRKIDNITKFAFDGDYDERALIDILDKDHVRAGVVTTYLKYANSKRGLVYTINKEHNLHVCGQFIENGISARTIDSDTKKEDREKIIQAFKHGEFEVLCNVNIFSEGFDCPDIEFVQLARPTKSLSMYLQQVGRGLRTSDDKKEVIFLDNVGLYKRFGLPSARRHWRKHFEGTEVTDVELSGSGEEDGDERFVSYFDEGDEVVDLVHSSKSESPMDKDDNKNIIDMKSYEKEFCDYMSTQNKNKSTISNYSVGISKYIDPCIKNNIDNSHTSIYHTIDIEMLDILQSELFNNKDFCDLNKEKHNRFSAALKQYIEFAKSYINSKTKSNADNVMSKTNDLSLQEIDNLILGLTKGGIDIPKELLDKKIKIERTANLSVEIKTRIEDLFSDINNDLSFHIQYSTNAGLTIKQDQVLTQVCYKQSSELEIEDNTHIEYNNPSVKKRIRVTLPDGRVIQCSKVKDTLLEVIKYAGVVNVEKLELYHAAFLISRTLDNNPKYAKSRYEIEQGFYVFTNTNTDVKRKQIQAISDRLNLGLKVEIV